MLKRYLAATMGVFMVFGLATMAEARQYHGHSHKAHSHKGSGVSRSCLTAAAQNLLSRIEANFGPVQIVSTCRPGARIAGTRKVSRHASGNAIDFNAGNRKGAILRWLMTNHHSGGTMTYARMGHIHVDIGPRFVKLNSGGRRYASKRYSRSRKVAMHSTHAKRSWNVTRSARAYQN